MPISAIPIKQPSRLSNCSPPTRPRKKHRESTDARPNERLAERHIPPHTANICAGGMRTGSCLNHRDAGLFIRLSSRDRRAGTCHGTRNVAEVRPDRRQSQCPSRGQADVPQHGDNDLAHSRGTTLRCDRATGRSENRYRDGETRGQPRRFPGHAGRPRSLPREYREADEPIAVSATLPQPVIDQLRTLGHSVTSGQTVGGLPNEIGGKANAIVIDPATQEVLAASRPVIARHSPLDSPIGLRDP